MRFKTKLLATIAFCGVGFALAGYSGYWSQNRLNNQLLDAVQHRQGMYTIHNLVREGANPNAAGWNEYDTALFDAIHLGAVPTIQTLLANGSSMRPIGKAHETPVFALACYQPMNAPNYPNLSVSDYTTLFRDFQHHGESIEERDALGYTPLMRAVWSGNPEATEALLKLGADSHVVNNYHQTVWYWIGQCPDKQDKLRRLLLQRKVPLKQTILPIRVQ